MVIYNSNSPRSVSSRRNGPEEDLRHDTTGVGVEVKGRSTSSEFTNRAGVERRPEVWMLRVNGEVNIHVTRDV